MCEPMLLSVKQAAKRLGFGRSVTYQWIRQGTLPSLKIGGARRVLASDLHEFVQRLKDASNDDGV
jgi:excisionase family DNA binding protein